jgi:hypothetical protein
MDWILVLARRLRMSGMTIRTPTWGDIGMLILAKLGFRKFDRMVAGGVKPAN